MTASIARHHADWLSLVDTSGPFVTLPVLKRTLPQGLEPTEKHLVGALRAELNELHADSARQRAFVRFVLTDLLEHGEQIFDGPAIPLSLAHSVPERGVTLRPDFALAEPTGSPPSVRMLVKVWPLSPNLHARQRDDKWSASPVDRMALLCRATKVPLGLVTDGHKWTLVSTVAGAATGTASWDADVWLEERITLDAFTTLLGRRRFFGAKATDQIESLLAESSNAQEEVTSKLGEQVRSAVSLLVDALGRADIDGSGQLLAGIDEPRIYAGAVTVMMRLVFLLYAEERRLFPIDEDLYNTSYAASTLRAELERHAELEGDGPLDRRFSAWSRLLSTFRVIHDGVQHEDLRLAAYGGGLFDPERYPFLEGRAEAGPSRTYGAPARISDLTVKYILDALQVLTFRSGGVTEARRLSFRSIDVEQIGHVYERLLDHSATRKSEVYLGFGGKHEPELALAACLGESEGHREQLISWLQEKTGFTEKQVASALSQTSSETDLRLLRVACESDDSLVTAIRPFLPLLRRDFRGLPAVYLPGACFVTKSSERRTSGAYYTPRSLAEEVVTHALEPLVYQPGPAATDDRTQWRLIPSEELLELRVCDMAMGSGGFLVAACRYLADRLVETSSEGAVASGVEDELSTTDQDALRIGARRTIAERCLYGVDLDPLAVEMAKLSLWLVTLAKDRPFSFVDHALRCGDSLLGLSSIEQIETLHFDSDRGRALHTGALLDVTAIVRPLAAEAVAKRRALEAFPVVDSRDEERKRALLADAELAVAQLAIIANGIAGCALTSRTARSTDSGLEALADSVAAALDQSHSLSMQQDMWNDLAASTEYALQAGRPPSARDRKCFHWPLEFPEVFREGRQGFDAIIGNPPFSGGKRISGALGDDYRMYLARVVARDVKGSADLVAYFFLRASQLLAHDGNLGLIGTNSIGQGDNRRVGLGQLDDLQIYRAWSEVPWPGEAGVDIAVVWARKGHWLGARVLDGRVVTRIGSALADTQTGELHPVQLQANAQLSFYGTVISGDGFLLDDARAQELFAKSSAYRTIVKPFLVGDDVMNRPDQSASRWVIDFGDMTLEQAHDYPECLAIVEQLVKPNRDAVKRDAYRLYWWRFAERCAALYRAIRSMDRIIVFPQTAKHMIPMMVSVGTNVFDHSAIVVASDDPGRFAVLASELHYAWSVAHGSKFRTFPRYTPAECLRTFAFPDKREELAELGEELLDVRRKLCTTDQIGLTQVYNRVHDEHDHSPSVSRIRDIHQDLHKATLRAYGWDDLANESLTFEPFARGVRLAMSDALHRTVLARLLELNHIRAKDETVRPQNQFAKAGVGTRHAYASDAQSLLQLDET